MDRAADTDKVECAELGDGVLELRFDESRRDARAFRRRARRLDHPRLRIDADNLPAEGRKADRQDARPGADIEQALTPIQPKRSRYGLEEGRAIRRSGAFVIGDSGGEASHGDPDGSNDALVKNHRESGANMAAVNIKEKRRFN